MPGAQRRANVPARLLLQALSRFRTLLIDRNNRGSKAMSFAVVRGDGVYGAHARDNFLPEALNHCIKRSIG